MALLPPIIPGTLPPVTKVYVKDAEKYKLTIPYEISGGVNPKNISGYNIIIKGIPSNSVYYQGELTIDTEETLNNLIIGYIPIINKLKAGNYYKLQLAFIDTNNIVGYYSTVGTFKLIATPITELDYNNGEIIFKYTPNQFDINEKLYTTKFYLYNQNTEILIEESEEIIYNYDNSNDTDGIKQIYKFNSTLKVGEIYQCVCKYTTANGYSQELSYKNIATTEIYPSPNGLFPSVSLDYTNGLINISIKKRTLDGDIIKDEYINTPKPIGNYLLTRASSKDNYEKWEIIKSFSLNAVQLSNNNIERILFKDLNIEHGVYYQYAIQQFNSNNLYSSKNYSDIIKADYEDMYLTDGIRQLRIAYNPKISSFKDTVLENKQDTIGSHFPFFFRNNEIIYKEFSLSGLLSYLSDPDNLFNINYSSDINTTNLVTDNIFKEKQYKLEVLNWLNNGENKLLKTATEGNYYVRLMNVSLSPNDTLGRMLHTFNAIAYEVENINIPLILDKTKEYTSDKIGIIALDNVNYTSSNYWEFNNKDKEKTIITNIKNLQFLNIEQNVTSPIQIEILYGKNDMTIVLRATEIGLFYFNNPNYPAIDSIRIYQSKNYKPIIYCEYEVENQDQSDTLFSSLTNLIISPKTGNTLTCSTYTSAEKDTYFGAISYCYDFVVVDESNNNSIKSFSYLDQSYKKHTYIVNKQLTLQNIFITKILDISEGLKIDTNRIKYVWEE